MNLFLRIVIVWFKALFKKRIGFLDAFQTNFSVWWTDQDMLRHVTNSRFFSLTDVCIIDYFLRARVWRALNKHKWFPLIVYEDMHFLKPLRHPHRFSVHSQFLGWDNDRIVASHRFVRGDGVLIATGYTVARFVDAKGKAVPVPTVAEALNASASPPLSPDAAAAVERSKAATLAATAGAASLAGSSAFGSA